MSKVRKDGRGLLNELKTLDQYNKYVEQNRGSLALDRAIDAIPEYTGDPNNPFIVKDLTEDQTNLLEVDFENISKLSQSEYLNKVEKDRLEEERLAFLAEQDKAFQNSDADFFQEEIGTSTLFAQKLATDIADKTSNIGELNNFFTSSSVDQALSSGLDPLSKVINNTGYTAVGLLDDIGAFFAAPLSARLPTFEAFGLTSNPANPAANSVFKKLDVPLKAVNNYLDDIANRQKNDPNSLSFFDSIDGFFIDNAVSRAYKDASATNKAISATYKLTDKTLTKDGWDAAADPNYWIDTVVQGGASAGSFLLAGGAVSKAGKVAGVGQKANQLFTALTLTNIEGTQIATDVANKVLRSTLDKYTDGQFTNSENFAVSKALETAANGNPNLSPQEKVRLEQQVKNEHLKKFVQDNPNAAEQAHKAAQAGFTQAASVNNANLVLNLTGAGLLVNGFRQELTKKPLRELGSTFLKEGSQEFVEEGVVNHLAEKSGTSVGLTGKYSSSDLTKDLFSLEAFEQGLAGFITGGLMGGGAVAMNYNNIKDNYNKQQDILNKYNEIENKNITDQDLLLNTATALSRGSRVDDLIQQYNLARASKSEPVEKAFEALILAEQVTSAIQSNTLPQLQEMYKKISTKEENSLETKTKAAQVLGKIQQIENSVRKNYNYLNTSEIVSKEALLGSTYEQENILRLQKDEILDKLTTHLKAFSSTAGLNIENPLENPYAYDDESQVDTKEYNAYNKFLNHGVTKHILQELETKNDEIYSIETLKNNTIGDINVSKSDTHQKYLKDKESLVFKLKSLKASIFDKNIRAVAKERNKVDVNVAYNKISNNLSATSKNEYNAYVDDIINDFAKKSKSISKEELTAIGKVFKLTDELTQNEQIAISNAATAAVLNNTVADSTNDEVIDAVENVELTGDITTPDSTPLPNSTISQPEVVTPTIETVTIFNENTGEIETVEVPEHKTLDQVELEQPESIQTLSNLIEQDKETLSHLRQQVEEIQKTIGALTKTRFDLANKIDYFKSQLEKGYDTEAEKILQDQLDKLQKQHDKANLEIVRLSGLVETIQPALNKGISTIDSIQLSEELQDIMSISLTDDAFGELTDDQKEKINRTMSQIGDTRESINTALNQDNSTGKVTMETRDESSIIRTRSIPFAKWDLVRSIDGLMNRITIAYNKFLEKVDNPNSPILGNIVSYELDTDLIDLFKNSNLQFNKDRGNRTGTAALFNFVNTGFKYYAPVLSDQLILEIPVKVKIDEDSYTYLVDDGYFKFSQTDKDGNIVYDDGHVVHPSQKAKYEQKVIEEKRKIIETLMAGKAAQSVITEKSYGFANRNNTFKPLNQLVDYSSNTQLFIVKEDGAVDGNGVSSTDVLKTHRINSGTLTVGSIGTTGDKILETLQNNKLDRANAEVVIEVVKFILDNPNNINEYMELSKDGKTVISGIKPLSVLDLILNLGSINSTTDPIFRQEVTIIKNKLESDPESAIKYVMTKYGSSSIKGLNTSLKNTIVALNDEKLNNKSIAPIKDNAVFKEFTAESSYNDVLATRFSTTLNKLAREKSSIITKFIEPQEISKDNVDGTTITPTEIPVGEGNTLYDVTDFNWDEPIGGSGNTAFSSIPLQQLEADGTLATQREWLSNNLPQIPAEEYNHILPLMNDKIALGYFITGLETLADNPTFGIKYSKYQPVNNADKGIIYHEAFHAVVRVLIPENEYNTLLEIADEETLAEAFRVYINTGQEFNDDRVVTLFDRIINYILNLLGVSNQSKVNKLFKDIATGKYKDARVRTERINKFGQAYSSISGGINPYIAKEAAKSLVMASLDNSSLETVEKITNKDILNILERTKQLHVQRGINTPEAEAFKKFVVDYNSIRLTQNIDGTVTENENNLIVQEANAYLENITKDKLKEQSEEYTGEVAIEENEPSDDENTEEKDESISKHIVDTSLIDYELKAPKFIKVLLASLPKKDATDNDVFNPVTGLRQSVDFKSQYTSLLHYLGGSFNDIVVDESLGVQKHNLAINKVFNKLKTLASFKTELRPLYRYLTIPTDTTEEAAEIVRRKMAMFYNAVALTRTDYVTVNFDEDTFEINNSETGETRAVSQFKVSLYETGKNDVSYEVIEKWRGDSDFLNRVVVHENNILKYDISVIGKITKNRQLLLDELEVINKIFQKENSRIISQEEKNKLYKTALDKIVVFFKTNLKVDLHPAALDLYVYESANQNGLSSITVSNGTSNYSRTAFNQLNTIFNTSTKLFDPTYEYGLTAKAAGAVDLKYAANTFKASLKELAYYQYLFQDHVGAASVKGPDNKAVFLFDYQSHLSNMFNFMSSGTIEAKKYVQTLNSKAEHSNSLYLEAIANNKIKPIRLLAFNDKRNNTSANGVDISYKNDLLLNLHLSLNSSLNKNFNSFVRMLSFADKSTSDIYYSIPNSLLVNPIKNIVDGNIELSSEIVDIFYNYLLSELERVLFKGDTGGLKTNKNKNKIFLFPEFSPSNADNNQVAKYIKTLQDTVKETTDIKEVLDKNTSVKAEIEKIILTFISNAIQDYKNAGVTLNEINPVLAAVQGTSYTLEKIIAQSVINGVIANVESTKLFTGSIAAYKDEKDFLKRTPFITTKGYNHNIDDVVKSKFKLAVLNTTPYASTIYTDEVVESFRPILENSYKHYIAEKGLNKTVEDFKDIINARLKNLKEAYTVKQDRKGELENQLDITDAQGYITLDRWYDIMKGLSRDTNDVKILYDKLKNGTATFEDHKKAQSFIQPLKGVVHELNITSSRFTKPVNIKYSQFVLTPQLVANSAKLQELYDKMTKQNIDEIVFDTASKGDMNGMNDFNSDEFITIDLNKNSWKLQVDFTAKTHKNKPSLVSTQAQKNIRSNIRFNDKYSNGQFGSQLIKDLNRIESTLINRKSRLFFNNTSIEKFASKLETISTTQKEALSSIPFSNLPQLYNAVETSLNSAIKKQITELKLNGGAFIQTSPEFFTVGVNDGNIRWLIDKKELTGSTLDKSAYILLPYNVVKGLTDEQLKTAEIDIRILEGLGVRIPNQPKSSIDKIKIAGFLPRGYGDTVVVYNEGTKKFGYDFDVDKKYIILPDVKYNPTTNSIDYIEPPKDSNYFTWSDSELRNKLIEIWQVLINDHFDEIVEPLDNNWLEDDIKEAGANLETAKGLNFFSTSYQIQVKRNNTLAKSLIGPFANFTSDIAANQYAGIYLPYKIGIGNTTTDGFIDLSQAFDETGNLITNTGLQYQNAAVDAGKNPYIVSGNINDYTVGVVTLLVKAGVNRKFPIKLMAQPVLKQYTELMSNGSTHYEAIKQLTGNRYDSYKQQPLQNATIDLNNAFKSNNNEIDQDLVLYIFDNLHKLAGLDTKQTLASKIDVNGGGKTMVDKFVLQENIRSLMHLTVDEFKLFNDVILGTQKLTPELAKVFNSKSDIKNFAFKFIDNSTSTNATRARLTVLGTHYATAVLAPQKLYQDDILVLNPIFQEYSIQVSNLLGEQYLTNKKTVKAIYDSFYNYVVKQSFNNNVTTLAEKLNSNTGLAAKINEFRSALDENGNELTESKNFAVNAFINQLFFTTDLLQGHTFVNIDNKKIKTNKEDIVYGFQQLLDGVYGPTGIEIGNDLIEYSLQSGVTYNLKSFFSYIPPSAFVNNLNTNVNIYEIAEQLFRHNTDNPIIVRQIKGKRDYIGGGVKITTTTPQVKNGVITPFISAKRFNKLSKKLENGLYQLEKYDPTTNTYTYSETYKLGYNTEYGQFNEYGLNNIKSINKHNNVKNSLPLNPEYLQAIATYPTLMSVKEKRKFESELIYAMPGTGKSTTILNNPFVVEPEPYYKMLLGSDSILEGQNKVTNNYTNREALEPIHQMVADWISSQLNEGKTVVAGLSFLAANPNKYGLSFSEAIILDNVEIFTERVRNREDNPIDYTTIDLTTPTKEDGTPNFVSDPVEYAKQYEKYKLNATSLGVNVVSLGSKEFLNDYINGKVDKLKANNNLDDNIKNPCR